jgi:hypothetical protein
MNYKVTLEDIDDFECSTILCSNVEPGNWKKIEVSIYVNKDKLLSKFIISSKFTNKKETFDLNQALNWYNNI